MSLPTENTIIGNHLERSLLQTAPKTTSRCQNTGKKVNKKIKLKTEKLKFLFLLNFKLSNQKNTFSGSGGKGH